MQFRNWHKRNAGAAKVIDCRLSSTPAESNKSDGTLPLWLGLTGDDGRSADLFLTEREALQLVDQLETLIEQRRRLRVATRAARRSRRQAVRPMGGQPV